MPVPAEDLPVQDWGQPALGGGFLVALSLALGQASSLRRRWGRIDQLGPAEAEALQGAAC